MIQRKTVLLCTAIFHVVAGMAAAQTGTITGVVPLPKRPTGRIAVEKYTGTISGKVDPPPPLKAGVWLEGPGTKPTAAPAKAVLAQQGYQFAESLTIVPVGALVEFPNRDAEYHNIQSFSRVKRFDLGRYKKDETPVPVETFDKPGFVRLGCEIHDHMSAAILVVDSRWSTLTDAKGSFRLTGISPGTYTLHAQVDEKNHWTVPITVQAGKTTTAGFTASPTKP
jgi:plastocyanin